MANITVYDIDNYPGVSKTVNSNTMLVTSRDSQGADEWVLQTTTSAYSNNATRAVIQPLFTVGLQTGWCKSSGLKAAPFTIVGGANQLLVAIDEPNNLLATISLTPGAGLTGDVVANDMQTQINALAGPGAARQGNLSYLNATVTFIGNVFKIISGSCGQAYVGSTKSAVQIVDSIVSPGCAAILGFDYPTASETIAQTAIKYTYLTSLTSSGTSSLSVADGSVIADTDCVVVFAPTVSGTLTPYKEYYKVTSTSNNTIGVTPNVAYAFPAGAKVQVLREADPDGVPVSAYSNLDSLVRFGIRSITAQIDFSS